MRFLKYFLLLPAMPLCAQGVHHTNTVFARGSGVTANLVPNASVRVCAPNTGCSTLISVYSDVALTQQIHQPVIADAMGNYSYYSATACVDEQYSSPGQGLVTRQNICASNGSSGGASFPTTPNIVVNTSTVASRNATASDIGSLLSTEATGCTSGMVYSPFSNSCVSTGGGSGSVIPAPQHQKTFYGTTGTASSVQGDTGATTDGAGNETFQTLSANVTNPLNNQVLNTVTTFNNLGGARNDFQRTTTFSGTGGRNYGNYPNVSVPWTTGGFNFFTDFAYQRGITQWLAGHHNSYKTGDTAGLYLYVTGVGGTTGYSDEGFAGMHLNSSQGPPVTNPIFTGTVTGSPTTGATTISHTAASIATCDGCFLADEKTGSPQITFTGPAVATNGYYLEPITGPVTPSTAYGVMACTLPIPELAVQTTPESVTCNVTGIVGSTGLFVAGVASLAGPFSEQVMITNVTGSGTTQSVTFLHRNPNPIAGVSLWQGGSVQGKIQMHDYLTTFTGQAQGEPCFGATDSTHVSCGINVGGALLAAQTGIFNTVNLANLTVSGTTVTAVASGGQNAQQFVGITGAIVAGCSDSTINGTAVNILATTVGTANAISWTYPGSGVGCTSATITLPASYATAHLYPYAEQIAGYGTTANAETVEFNIVPWASGDSLVQPNPPSWSGAGIWSTLHVANTTAGASSSHLLLDGSGAGISNGFPFIHIRNNNPENYYEGAGGVTNPPPFMLFYGPNSGSSIVEPMPGYSFFTFACRISGCDNTIKSVLAVDGASNNGVLTYAPSTGAWNFSGTLNAASMTLATALTSPTISGGNLTTTGTTQLHNTSLLGTVNMPFTGFANNCIQAGITGIITGTGAPCNLVSSVFGRTGVVLPVSGDYTVSQVTGAAPLASPALTGVPTVPTATPGTNTTQAASTAFVLANAGSGLVTSVSVTSANGVSGTSSGGSTPALTLALGAITPSSVSITGTGIPISTGVTSNTDLAGQITLASGVGTYTFTTTHLTAPIVVCSDTSATPAPVGCSATTTTITINGSTTGVINYIVIGRT